MFSNGLNITHTDFSSHACCISHQTQSTKVQLLGLSGVLSLSTTEMLTQQYFFLSPPQTDKLMCLYMCVFVCGPVLNRHRQTLHIWTWLRTLYYFQTYGAWCEKIQFQLICWCACLDVCLNIERSQLVSLLRKLDTIGVEMFVSVGIFQFMFISERGPCFSCMIFSLDHKKTEREGIVSVACRNTFCLIIA